MSQSYKVTFSIILALIFLAPLFFIPGNTLHLTTAKSALLSLGAVLLLFSYLYESWVRGELSFPKHGLLLTVLLLPVVYLLSAVLSTPSSLSLLGYSLEVGTFGYMLMGTVALLVASSMTVETERHLQALAAFFASLSLLGIFSAIKIIFGGDLLAFGNFAGNMGNPLGSWTDMAVAFGILASLSALAIGMIPMRTIVKTAVYGVFALSTALLVVMGFSTAFGLTLVSALLLWAYLGKVEKDFLFHPKEGKKNFFAQSTFLPIVLVVVSLLMFINPTLSDTKGKLVNVVSEKFEIRNADVRPTLSATLGISKAVLSSSGLFGSGPNTFGQDWMIFRSMDINATPFWDVAFPFGLGFIPTQIASTGILGSALWLAFFGFLVALAVRAMTKVPDSRAARFVLISTLLISLSLWTAVVFYVPSSALFFLAFIFLGLLLSLLRDHGTVPSYVVDLERGDSARSVALVFMALALVLMGYFGFLSGKKTLASYHFEKAVRISNNQGDYKEVESELMRALRFNSADTYFSALSQLNLSKAQAAANSKEGTPEGNQALFEEGLRVAIQSARSAVAVNPASYANWIALGNIYSALVPEPLKVEGAYENAKSAYGEAMRRNPNNPQLPLFLARLEMGKGNTDEARSYIRNSMALKEDYADAYLLLAQLEIEEKNIPAAIASTEVLAKIAPENAGIHFELGVLKYSNNAFEAALTSLKEALRLSPEYANAKYYMALTYTQLGMMDEARVELEALLEANPGNVELQSALDNLNNSESE